MSIVLNTLKLARTKHLITAGVFPMKGWSIEITVYNNHRNIIEKTFLSLDPQKTFEKQGSFNFEKADSFLILSCSGSTADGNCLFNSCSLSMIGDESLQGALRILTCIELYKNVKHYAYHPRLAEAWQEPNHSDFERIKSIFSVTLSDETIVSTYSRKEDNREESIKEEAKLMQEMGEDASFVCMHALFEKIST